MEIVFNKQSFFKRLKALIKVDFRRMFTMPLVYIMIGISFILPILILVMTSMMGDANEESSFTNAWQIIGSTSLASSMDLASMCNVNMIFFISVIFACIFISNDFKSGFSKNLFTNHYNKFEFIISKTASCFIGSFLMLVAFLIGSIIGGEIAGLSFSTLGFGVGGVIFCFISKIFLLLVFVSLALLFSVIAKERLWLSIILSLVGSILIYSMIPMIVPITSSFLNVLLCLIGGIIFNVIISLISNLVLNKTNLV